jgi:hypothetical protein
MQSLSIPCQSPVVAEFEVSKFGQLFESQKHIARGKLTIAEIVLGIPSPRPVVVSGTKDIPRLHLVWKNTILIVGDKSWGGPLRGP